jgi:predicted membrane channel-forming protein YqfA (hemolysin III family)
MTFFSDPTRHGDPSHPYPRKRIPPFLTRAVLVLGFVPEAFACLGVMVTLRRRTFRPLLIMCFVSMAAYVWWFSSQQHWGLKTKYLLFLLPAFVVYTVAGVGWFWRRVSWATAPAAVLLAALLVMTHMYLLAFAVG